MACDSVSELANPASFGFVAEFSRANKLPETKVCETPDNAYHMNEAGLKRIIAPTTRQGNSRTTKYGKTRSACCGVGIAAQTPRNSNRIFFMLDIHDFFESRSFGKR